jgi:hypothetical protein
MKEALFLQVDISGRRGNYDRKRQTSAVQAHPDSEMNVGLSKKGHQAYQTFNASSGHRVRWPTRCKSQEVAKRRVVDGAREILRRVSLKMQNASMGAFPS